METRLTAAAPEAVIVVGAGGHAKVVIEILRDCDVEVAYCVARPDAPSHCVGVPVLRAEDALDDLYRRGYRKAVVALGDNHLRARLGQQLRGMGYALASAVSPQATISRSATIGDGVVVMAGVVVNAQARIDDLAILNSGATVDHDCHIGRSVHVAPQCALAGNVRVGENTMLGIGARVIPGVTIGRDVMVGAGAVVIRDISDGVTAVGVPAREVVRTSRYV
jgi:UDP-perosamine 4-acetyltransferase